jgi:uncharacterized membrane protein
MLKRLRTYFLTGSVVAVPLLVTVTIILAVVRTVDSWVAPLLPEAVQRLAVPGLGLLVGISVLTLLGMLTANFAGRLLIDWSDRLIARVPLIGSIYRPVRQILESFRPGARSFRQVVLISYPHPGSQSLAFVTGDAPAEIGEGKLAVFVPTSPNLYAGFLLFLPPEAITPLNMSVEDAIRLQVSAGIAKTGQAPGSAVQLPLPSSQT